MKGLLRVSAGIDRFTETTGRLIFWLVLVMILMGAFNALARYTTRFTGVNLSSNAFIELQWYLFSAVFLLGAAYALKHGSHVRVDVLYGRVSSKTRARINIAGTMVFLLPFCLMVIWVSWPSVRGSWSVWEQSPDPGGLPRYPIKTMLPIAFVLVIVQGFSELIKQIAVLRGLLPEDSGQFSDMSEGA